MRPGYPDCVWYLPSIRVFTPFKQILSPSTMKIFSRLAASTWQLILSLPAAVVSSHLFCGQAHGPRPHSVWYLPTTLRAHSIQVDFVAFKHANFLPPAASTWQLILSLPAAVVSSHVRTADRHMTPDPTSVPFPRSPPPGRNTHRRAKAHFRSSF